MRKSAFLIILMIGLIMLCQSVFAGKWIRTTLNYDGEDHEYFAEEISIEINNEQVTFDTMPVILNSRTLIPVRGVFEKLGCIVEWDEKTQIVMITDENKQIVLQIGNDTAYKDGIGFKMDSSAMIINSRTMIPLRAVSEALGYYVEWSNEKRLISIYDKQTNAYETTQTTVVEAETKTETTTQNTVQDIVVNDGITIVWDQVSNQLANQGFINDDTIKADVICPTWFAVKDSAGTVSDLGSPEYVMNAKSRGMKVWGLISNSFDSTITHNVLSDSTKRANLIAEMVRLCQKYNLDGMNIDFESVSKTDGDIYYQFIKESADAFKEENLTISVDTYIPTSYNEHYNMEGVGEVADYVIIMDYDEHYSTCGVAGSVSSLPWFTEAIKNSCEKVDKDKLIVGMPFYTRLWADDGNSVTSTSKSMSAAEELVSDKTVTFDETAGQDYCEYSENGITYKIWLENSKSMQSRLEAAKSYNVKGAAFWRRGFEKAEIWDLIKEYY